MTRHEYTENHRTLQASIARDPVQAALSGIMCLNRAQRLELQARLAAIAERTSGDRVTLAVEVRQ